MIYSFVVLMFSHFTLSIYYSNLLEAKKALFEICNHIFVLDIHLVKIFLSVLLARLKIMVQISYEIATIYYGMYCSFLKRNCACCLGRNIKKVDMISSMMIQIELYYYHQKENVRVASRVFKQVWTTN